ncbi:hypothetical protein A2697_03825 [Candidatus Curtissbacteria bacterium RIFCSPHIGHO2_01_FULL_41_44]|uniref:Uncharacterized protein n=1 Tax=Candidatus Curtissbacteria bacterium RIFCSPLOWO2_01_FULL_42_50 TaxID=1797730 RepID=A0A1F5H7Q9_9BACT|nr:MAG: hypothetical protein A2697_03825 [Candidatus Curtissbacteria bacterium RIFCSPHIGHO2_01_FULL_41_44]OGE00161.1 MAG: hypothetical protein A3B54_02040 [Candidatus Curtissbacteria bacterium RIFCSPLOWO2_01_FULL_42_50]OGE09750.1 MAG: hypothetical protein A3H87_02390 [Candidatus Curtissbacteria bacterium RIFCSPLOWO2_02_FULL_42_37]
MERDDGSDIEVRIGSCDGFAILPSLSVRHGIVFVLGEKCSIRMFNWWRMLPSSLEERNILEIVSSRKLNRKASSAIKLGICELISETSPQTDLDKISLALFDGGFDDPNKFFESRNFCAVKMGIAPFFSPDEIEGAVLRYSKNALSELNRSMIWGESRIFGTIWESKAIRQ